MSTDDSAKPVGTPWLRYLIEYGPLAVFMLSFFAGGRHLLTATAWLVGASIVAVAASLLLLRRVAPLVLFTAAMSIFFGGLSLVLRNPVFLQIKLTVVDTAFGLVLVGCLAFRRNPLKALMGDAVQLTDRGWRGLTLRYAIFCFLLAAANEGIRRTQSEAVWVFFRMPGVLLLTVLFSIVQAPFMLKDMQAAEEERAAASVVEVSDRLTELQE